MAWDHGGISQLHFAAERPGASSLHAERLLTNCACGVSCLRSQAWSALSNLTMLLVWQNRVTGTLPAVSRVVTLLMLQGRGCERCPTCVGDAALLLDSFLACVVSCLQEYSALLNAVTVDLNTNNMTGTLPKVIFVDSVQGCNRGERGLFRTPQLGRLEVKLDKTHIAYTGYASSMRRHSRSWSCSGVPCMLQEWSALTQLTWLNVANNQLNGTLPVQWSALSTIANMQWSLNRVTGTLPVVRRDMAGRRAQSKAFATAQQPQSRPESRVQSSAQGSINWGDAFVGCSL